MITVETKKEAIRAAKEMGGEYTYRKVQGGWAIMTWQEWIVWKKQK